MATPACNAFSSINDALVQANMGQLNITAYVAACPNICTLAWGTGNPDLSGIGANISYILQAILTFIFGPLFCLVYAFRERWNFSDETKKNLKSLQATFHDISAQFSIPVAVAAIIRSHQHAPFYELAFLRSLMNLQFLSLLSSSVTAGIFEKTPTLVEKRHDRLRIAILVLYGLLEFGLYVGLIGGLRTSQSSWQTISELGEACTAYSRIEPWIHSIPAPSVHLPHITVKEYFSPFSKNGWKFSFIIIGFILAGILALGVACLILVGLWLALVSREARVLGPISLAFAIGMLVEVIQMERTRNVMKAVTGAEFQDNQWGFGQVIALFLWVPLCLQSLYNILLIVFGSENRNLSGTKDVEKAPGSKTTPDVVNVRKIQDDSKTQPEEKNQEDDKVQAEDRAQSEEEDVSSH
ncbi:hypothetical protein DFH09DRAFT_1205701 [Mycena vulgaris]|nr:hypothetical protein DFH09DRAFT_1205701 [Mycena vulgaris]